ncbi:hypothetical protein K443DRAFT_116820, partial [Laccaria amethystina LaAM-08-1]
FCGLGPVWLQSFSSHEIGLPNTSGTGFIVSNRNGGDGVVLTHLSWHNHRLILMVMTLCVVTIRQPCIVFTLHRPQPPCSLTDIALACHSCCCGVITSLLRHCGVVYIVL